MKKIFSILNIHILFLLSLLTPFMVQADCENITASTPDSRLIDNGDQTISDLATQLMWKKCSEGQDNDDTCSGSTSTHTWQSTLQVPQILNASEGFAGYKDWRLPNIKELRSIVEVACDAPSINSIRFPNTAASNYWSNTASADNSNNAWRVEFEKGESSASRSACTSSYLVRLVRN